jgi:tetratricopeptide (TPR) repeat protein
VRRPRAEWRALDDLEPQLAEIEMRLEGQEYESAAEVLLEIDFDFLLLWGHCRKTAALHERLAGKLRDPYQRASCASNLGTAYLDMARYREAMRCYEQALAIAGEVGDRHGVGADLSNLGGCYQGLGQLDRALELYKQSLATVHEIGYRQGEGTALGNLGNGYAGLGQLERALELYEQALAILHEVGDRRGEGMALANLASNLVHLGRSDEAAQHARAAVTVAEAIGDTSTASYSHRNLALSLLCSGDLVGARTAAEQASRYDEPQNNAYVLGLLGVIALRQGDSGVAQDAFARAVEHAGRLLEREARNYEALDARGLALCGLTLCGGDRIQEAVDAYRSARAVTTAPGIVGHALRLLDLLAPVDAAGVLAPARAAAVGR